MRAHTWSLYSQLVLVCTSI